MVLCSDLCLNLCFCFCVFLQRSHQFSDVEDFVEATRTSNPYALTHSHTFVSCNYLFVWIQFVCCIDDHNYENTPIGKSWYSLYNLKSTVTSVWSQKKHWHMHWHISFGCIIYCDLWSFFPQPVGNPAPTMAYSAWGPQPVSTMQKSPDYLFQ